MNTKFKIKMHYIQDSQGNKASVWYSIYDDRVTIVGNRYREFSDIDLSELGQAEYRDDSDSMTDYFCKPTITLYDSNPFAAEVRKVQAKIDKARALKKLKAAAKREELLSSDDVIKPIKKGYMRVIDKKEIEKNGYKWTYFELQTLQRPNKSYIYAEREDRKRYIPVTQGSLSRHLESLGAFGY